MTPQEVDGTLVEWGDRLFYGRRKFTKSPKGADPLKAAYAASLAKRAADIRVRVARLATPKAIQVMVKISGGGRGMKAIRAHLTYIAKHGKLEMETERGELVQGKEALRDVMNEWRIGGHSPVPETSTRREAFHIIFSMPDGTSPVAIKEAAAAVAKSEFAGHVYAMVLHEHQANPHVHLAVRAQGFSGKRLNPRKADLARWREVFAQELRDRGIEAVATRQPVHGASRNHPPRWRVAASQEGRARTDRPGIRDSASAKRSRLEALAAWAHVHQALSGSEHREDKELAAQLGRWLGTDPRIQSTRDMLGTAEGGRQPQSEHRLAPRPGGDGERGN